eukprot:CAMPEP_0182451592 /NCGR_PEP_ID=MMETSP1172-20130603/43801_1 /TAXON_ID=708627 /ORGANISM="Timspurckia oligopyrenoides, Strain CCMP3278" /LENGTH=738 /DNA_ID=CAMNT_0024649375 /DNA_START=16 /DNA_END=2232 /DNA_ORIENTATION=-
MTLKHARIIQRDLVYVMGLSPTLAREEALRRNELFGRFGTITLLFVNRVHHFNTNAPGGPSMSAYIQFSKETDAAYAARTMNGEIMDGREIRCAISATKYCEAFTESPSGNGPSFCDNPECLYRHELAPESDVLTREEMMNSQLGPPPPPHLFRSANRNNSTSGKNVRTVMGVQSSASRSIQNANPRNSTSAVPIHSSSTGSPPGQQNGGISAHAGRSPSHSPTSEGPSYAESGSSTVYSPKLRDPSVSAWGSPPIASMVSRMPKATTSPKTHSPEYFAGATTASWNPDPPKVKQYPPGYVDPFEEEKSVRKSQPGQTTSVSSLSSPTKQSQESAATHQEAAAVPHAAAASNAQNGTISAPLTTNTPPGFTAKPVAPPPGFSGPNRAVSAVTSAVDGQPPALGPVSMPPGFAVRPASNLPPGFENVQRTAAHVLAEHQASRSSHTQAPRSFSVLESGPRDVSAELREIMKDLKGSLGLSDDYAHPALSTMSQSVSARVAAPAAAAAPMSYPADGDAASLYNYSDRSYSRFGFAREAAVLDSRAVESSAYYGNNGGYGVMQMNYVQPITSEIPVRQTPPAAAQGSMASESSFLEMFTKGRNYQDIMINHEMKPINRSFPVQLSSSPEGATGLKMLSSTDLESSAMSSYSASHDQSKLMPNGNIYAFPGQNTAFEPGFANQYPQYSPSASNSANMMNGNLTGPADPSYSEQASGPNAHHYDISAFSSKPAPSNPAFVPWR